MNCAKNLEKAKSEVYLLLVMYKHHFSSKADSGCDQRWQSCIKLFSQVHLCDKSFSYTHVGLARVGDKTKTTSITVERPLLSFKFTLNFAGLKKSHTAQGTIYIQVPKIQDQFYGNSNCIEGFQFCWIQMKQHWCWFDMLNRRKDTGIWNLHTAFLMGLSLLYLLK